MQNMLGPNEEEVKSRLLDLVKRTLGKTTEEVGVTGGNAVTLLIRRDPLALRGRNLSNTNLNRANFSKANLTDSNLSNANLRDTQFHGVTLEGSNMQEADLTNAQFSEMGAMLAIAFSPDGTMLAGGGEDTNIHLWDVTSGSQLSVLRGHTGPLNSISWRNDGYHLVSGSDDGTIRSWNLEDGNPSTDLKIGSHAARVTTVCFSPDGKSIASGGADGTVVIWTYPEGDILIHKKFTGHVYGVRYSPDGRLIANRSRRATMVIWSADTGEEVCKFEGGKYGDAITHIDFHPNGVNLALTVSNTFFRIWNMQTLEIVQDIGEHGAKVTDMHYSPNGDQVASGSVDKTIHIYASSNGKLLRVLSGHEGTVNSISYDPSGSLLASGSEDATIRFWDVRPFVTRRREANTHLVGYISSDLSTITDNKSTWPNWWKECQIDVPEGLLPNPDFGKCLLTIEQKLNCRGLQLARAKGLEAPAPGGSGTLGAWLASRGATLEHVIGTFQRMHIASANSISWSPDGKYLAVGYTDETILIWDVTTGSKAFTYSNHSTSVRSVAWSPNGSYIASSSDDAVQVWNATTGSSISTYPGYASAVRWSPDSTRIVFNRADRTVEVRNVTKRGNIFTRGGTLTYRGHRHENDSPVLAWSPDGKHIASAIHNVKIWDAITGQDIFYYDGHKSDVMALAWSPDSTCIASGGQDQAIRVWEVTEKGEIWQGHLESVRDIAWSPNGKYIVSASNDGAERLWDAITGTQVFTYGPHLIWVNALAWSPNGKCIASAHDDGTVQVWVP
jgi:WD40 repeat protein